MNAADYTPLTPEEMAPLSQVFRRCKTSNRYLRAVLELTYRCNYKCPHCFVHTDVSNHGYRQKELTTAEWCGVIDQLAADGCLVLTFTGGEVFCRSDWYELALYSREKRFALRIFTNASYIDDRLADQLAEVMPMRVEVSLYGASQASYRTVAGHEIYLQKTIDGIDRLVARDISVVIKAPLMQANFHEMDQLADMALSRWNHKISFSPHMVPRDDRDGSPLAQQLTAEQLKHYLTTHSPPVRESIHTDDSKPPCTLARDYLVISPFGDVFPCVNIKRSVGNVRERAIRKIWDTAPFLTHLRQITVGDFRPHYSEEEFKTVGICPGAVYRETGSPIGALSFSKTAARVCKDLGGRLDCGCG